MKQATKDHLLRIGIGIAIVILLVTAVLGIQKTNAQQKQFEKISQEVDEFTASVEEQYPSLKETRKATEEKVNTLAGA